VSARRALAWIVLFAALGAAGSGLLTCGQAPLGPHRALDATVTRVVDGDTVKVRVAGRRETVRYIGVDTPESVKPGTPVQCFAKAASARNRQLVAGQPVTLRTDAEARDRYGRLLAYVYRRRDGLFVNAALVRDGYARTLTIPPNVSHAPELDALQRAARVARRGLWGLCPLRW
jgi:micrococcal nuclease